MHASSIELRIRTLFAIIASIADVKQTSLEFHEISSLEGLVHNTYITYLQVLLTYLRTSSAVTMHGYVECVHSQAQESPLRHFLSLEFLPFRTLCTTRTSQRLLVRRHMNVGVRLVLKQAEQSGMQPTERVSEVSPSKFITVQFVWQEYHS